jgi:hypothetical protein
MLKVYNYDQHVEAFPHLTSEQRQRLGIHSGTLQPLHDDGKVGPLTLAGLFMAPSSTASELLNKALWACEQGAQETVGANNAGPWPALFYGALDDDFTPEDRAKFAQVEQGPWCAAFVSWCIREVMGKGQPQAWGARRLVRRWAVKPGSTVSLAECRAGDLVCWRRHVPGEPAAGHVGIVYGRSGDLVFIVEGNGTRAQGAVGVYAYRVSKDGERGIKKPQRVIMVARR